MKDHIFDYLLSKNIIFKQQYGFIRKHSITTNLLESSHYWIVGLGCANNVEVVQSFRQH